MQKLPYLEKIRKNALALAKDYEARPATWRAIDNAFPNDEQAFKNKYFQAIIQDVEQAVQEHKKEKEQIKINRLEEISEARQCEQMMLELEKMQYFKELKDQDKLDEIAEQWGDDYHAEDFKNLEEKIHDLELDLKESFPNEYHRKYPQCDNFQPIDKGLLR